MQIEPNTFYRTKAGAIVGPAVLENSSSGSPWLVPHFFGPYYYSDDGRSCVGCEEDDLVEAVEDPILREARRTAAALACEAMRDALGNKDDITFCLKGPGGYIIVPFTSDAGEVSAAASEYGPGQVYIHTSNVARTLLIELRWGMGTGKAVGGRSASLARAHRSSEEARHINDLFGFVRCLDI